MESSKAPRARDSRLRQVTARDKGARRPPGKEEPSFRKKDCRGAVPLRDALKPSGLAWLMILPVAHFCRWHYLLCGPLRGPLIYMVVASN